MTNYFNVVERIPSKFGIEPYYNAYSEILFVGSIASKKSCEGGWYYASKNYIFRKLLDDLISSNIGNKEKFDENIQMMKLSKKNNSMPLVDDFFRDLAKSLMDKYHFAICDIFERAYIINDTSNDNDIILINPKDYPYKTNEKTILHIIDFSNIKVVVFTSKQVEKWFNSLIDIETIQSKNKIEIITVVTPSNRGNCGYKAKLTNWNKKLGPILKKIKIKP